MGRVVNPYVILKGPLITEKSQKHQAKFNKYAFVVDIDANKIEIKKAIETIYNVKVEDINTMIVKGKPKRIGWRNHGKTSKWKKAIVTLAKGQELKFI